MSAISFDGALSDAQLQVARAGFTTELWEPEFGWRHDEEEASEASHPPQMLAAFTVFLQFFVATTHRVWVHLAAEMQAGKTGVVNALVRLIFANASKLRIRPERVFVITGMNDTAWVKQTQERLPANTRDGVAHNGGLSKIHSALRKLAAGDFLSNVLLVVDESHIASATGNRPHAIYQLVAELCPRDKWDERGIRFLTISATDPAKAVSMDARMPFSARVVVLHTTPAYQSVRSLSEAGRLRKVEDYGELHVDARSLIELKKEIGKCDGPKYHIIRCRQGKTDLVASNLATVFPACTVIPWDSASKSGGEGSSSSQQDINDLLMTPPTGHTFILLKNMFYASKTMDDTHVGVLWDRAGGKDDTNLQSLLGRGCGYGKSQSTVIYTSGQTVQNYLTFWQEVIAGAPPPPTKIPISKLDKKMAGTRVERGGAGVSLFTGRGLSTPAGGVSGSSGGSGGSSSSREVANEDNFTSEWREFPTFEAAKTWGKSFHRPTLENGYYHSSTTGKKGVIPYAAVIALKGGKKTANMPSEKMEVGDVRYRLYTCYRDVADPASVVFVVRCLTKIN